MAVPDTITIRRPDDWHVHFRDGAMLRAVLPLTARQFGRAIVMRRSPMSRRRGPIASALSRPCRRGPISRR